MMLIGYHTLLDHHINVYFSEKWSKNVEKMRISGILDLLGTLPLSDQWKQASPYSSFLIYLGASEKFMKDFHSLLNPLSVNFLKFPL